MKYVIAFLLGILFAAVYKCGYWRGQIHEMANSCRARDSLIFENCSLKRELMYQQSLQVCHDTCYQYVFVTDTIVKYVYYLEEIKK